MRSIANRRVSRGKMGVEGWDAAFSFVVARDG